MAYLDSSNVEDLVADIKALADQTYIQDASYVHTDNNYTTTAKNAVDALGNLSTLTYTEVLS